MSLLKRLEKEKNISEEPVQELRTNRPIQLLDPWKDFKNQVHHEVIQTLDTSETENLEVETLRPKVEEIFEKKIEVQGITIPRTDRQRLIQQILDEILGFGPITPLLNDPDINEIMVNGPHQIYVERKGKLELVPITFYDDQHVLHIIEKIVAPLGRRIDESQPMVDARLPDGSRVNAIIPPLALNGPTLTIRKFAKDPFKVEDLIRFGTLTAEMALFLEVCVNSRLNIIVSGGTGSGKTTTLGVLSSYIPEDERIITIEDAAELQLRQAHVVTLETRPPNIEGKGAITIRDLVRNSLRMRPERIIVGEVRSGEALDMLQAMNTGHDGSLTTGHANTPRDMLSRLETMVLMAGMDLPVRAIREQISSALDVIVQQSRLRDGTRRVTHITEVLGMEGDVIVLQDIFRFEQTGIDKQGKVLGYFRATGIRPHFMEKLLSAGQSLPENLFSNEG
ncbi:CpaF family protein [Desulfitobacterium sp.]|uniref:CpaF family protein n=1 Tax=Desulfitobacterium sp. TaxID=49981 RepID=UPI002C65DD09|nr:CpaF family protein [Desulfitobacterium sp.]HVJ48569.1 CpaF family protein [Desulfitobacterium sp.]